MRGGGRGGSGGSGRMRGAGGGSMGGVGRRRGGGRWEVGGGLVRVSGRGHRRARDFFGRRPRGPAGGRGARAGPSPMTRHRRSDFDSPRLRQNTTTGSRC